MIATSELTLEIGSRRILDRVGFEVRPGEAVGLVGPNGSGKTSVLRCLLGLVPFTGSATVGGHDVVSQPIAARTLLGYLPQKPAFGDATAAEVLHFVARLRRIDRTRVRAVLDEVGLEAHAGERARIVSGGMQQRLALAVVLLGEARVLLLDEPTASLDRDGQRVFYDVIRRLRASGVTMLLSSHRPEELSRLTDRVLQLDSGRLAAAPAEPSAAPNLAPVVPIRAYASAAPPRTWAGRDRR